MKCKDFLVSGKFFEILPNEKHEELLKTHPVPPLSELQNYYESDDYISHTDASDSLFDKAYQWVKKHNLNYKYKIISKVNSGKKLLDYGCGTGSFLEFMKEKGFEVSGFEPNPKVAELAEQKIKTGNVFQADWFDENQKYDVITLWHVLEHVPNLWEEIERLKKSLNPGGVLFLALPNYQSFDAKYYKEFWAAYDVPRHLWHFSPGAVNSIFDDFGMKVEKTYPLWFDALYVSMLSEKHKKSFLGNVKGLSLGALSNLIALKTHHFSSLTYQIKQKNEINEF